MSPEQSDNFQESDNSKPSDSFKQSDSFRHNRFVWTVFGLWPGNIPEKYYKFFSFIYLIISYVAYNALLALNLYHTPRKMETFIREIIFTFTEIAIGSKMSMVLYKRNKISSIFEMLDREEFKGNDETGKGIVRKYNDYYKKYMLYYTVMTNISFLSHMLFPLFGFLIAGNTLDLPVCKYYFLSDETRNNYFILIFVYQTFFLYGHMMYNVNIHILIAGFMGLAIGQVKVLCHDMENLKMEKSDGRAVEVKQQHKLRKVLNHYELFLKYCEDVQDVIGGTMFVEYGIGSVIMCVIMCGFVLPSPAEAKIFMVGYFVAMNMTIFVPAWLGTQLTYESDQLTTAAYKSEWLPRTESYKRSIRLFMERAKKPIIITGLGIFHLSLATYIQIMKTAYSCFTLLRIIQDRQEQATP